MRETGSTSRSSVSPPLHSPSFAVLRSPSRSMPAPSAAGPLRNCADSLEARRRFSRCSIALLGAIVFLEVNVPRMIAGLGSTALAYFLLIVAMFGAGGVRRGGVVGSNIWWALHALVGNVAILDSALARAAFAHAVADEDEHEADDRPSYRIFRRPKAAADAEASVAKDGGSARTRLTTRGVRAAGAGRRAGNGPRRAGDRAAHRPDRACRRHHAGGTRRYRFCHPQRSAQRARIRGAGRTGAGTRRRRAATLSSSRPLDLRRSAGSDG